MGVSLGTRVAVAVAAGSVEVNAGIVESVEVTAGIVGMLAVFVGCVCGVVDLGRLQADKAKVMMIRIGKTVLGAIRDSSYQFALCIILPAKFSDEVFTHSVSSKPLEIPMIARTWHGITKASKANEYLDYLNKTGIAAYRTARGNLGVYVLRRIDGNKAHFLLLTLWESEVAIKRFTGSNMEKAKYYPEDEQFLLELEPTVTHYEVLVEP